MKVPVTITRSINSLSERLTHRGQMYLLSFVVGVISGLAAVILKNTAHYTHEFVARHSDLAKINFLYLAFPMIGVILTVLFVRFFIKDEMGHGITKVLYSISKKVAT